MVLQRPVETVQLFSKFAFRKVGSMFLPKCRFRQMGFSHFRRVISRGVSATTVGANAKQARKTPQINPRFLVAIFESRSASPATTAITETGIQASVPKLIMNGAYDASTRSVGHQNLYTANPGKSAQD